MLPVMSLHFLTGAAAKISALSIGTPRISSLFNLTISTKSRTKLNSKMLNDFSALERSKLIFHSFDHIVQTVYNKDDWPPKTCWVRWNHTRRFRFSGARCSTLRCATSAGLYSFFSFYFIVSHNSTFWENIFSISDVEQPICIIKFDVRFSKTN